jgi:hypothetical protein
MPPSVDAVTWLRVRSVAEASGDLENGVETLVYAMRWANVANERFARFAVELR